MVEFLFSEAGANDVSVFEKDFTIDVLLQKKLRKAKIMASKGQKK